MEAQLSSGIISEKVKKGFFRSEDRSFYQLSFSISLDDEEQNTLSLADKAGIQGTDLVIVSEEATELMLGGVRLPGGICLFDIWKGNPAVGRWYFNSSQELASFEAREPLSN